jgi:perosamine synthetase
MPEHPLPYGRQSIDADDVEAVREALTGDFLTTGPLVERFEAELCAATGAQHAVAVDSGTAALHAAYRAAGLGPGDELVTSPLTFVATASAALHLGAGVRFADVEPDTGNLDARAAGALAGPRTRAIAGVDFAGHPCDWDALNELAAERSWVPIADAAHSLGARLRGRAVGTLAPLTATSFHPVKIVTTAEGGALLARDAEHARIAREFRNHGIVRDPRRLERSGPGWYHEVQSLGFNYRLPDVLCALGLSQLRKLARFLARRRELAGRYFEGLRDVAGLELPAVRAGVEPAWHLFVVRVRDVARRDAFFERLRERGLLVQVHYRPVHLHPVFRELGFRPGLCPVAEDFAARALSLPLYPALSDADAARVIETVRSESRELL